MRRKPFPFILFFYLAAFALQGCAIHAQENGKIVANVPVPRFERWQGHVVKTDADTKHLLLRLADGTEREVSVANTAWYFDGNTWPDKNTFNVLRNGKENMYSFAGILYSGRDDLVANQEIRVFSYTPGQYMFEAPEWWLSQSLKLSEFWIKAQFDATQVNEDFRPLDAKGDIIVPDGRHYRTRITKEGHKRSDDTIQETATLSRLIYGLSSAYLMNGHPGLLEAARALVNYQRKYMSRQIDEKHLYWIHARKENKGKWVDYAESLYSYDKDTIPLYEQIYDLAGLMQYYRVTGDPEVLADIEKTVAFMDDYYWDKRPEKNGAPKEALRQGYFSHIRDNSKKVDDVSLTNSNVDNCLKKNWNSIGDHIPAYLENLYLATRDKHYLIRMTNLGLIIAEHFPDDKSPFVFERFDEFWNPDLTYNWQQNRAVVGHNLKIGWCLTRLYYLTGEKAFLNTAKKAIDAMTVYGQDKERGGWYDVIERNIDAEHPYTLTFHNRKAWWQQEQGILANYLLYTAIGRDQYLESARSGAAFYNLAFLDLRDNGTFFDVQADGTPFLDDDERADKGSHSKSGYHDLELAYFAHLYTNLLIKKRLVLLHFNPLPAASGKVFYVQPISLPKETVRIEKVEIDGAPYDRFNPNDMSIQLPLFKTPITVTVTLSPLR